MNLGIPREVKNGEGRVALVPNDVAVLLSQTPELDGKLKIFVETSAGVTAGFSDADYEAAGATIVDNAEDLYGSAEYIVKVKEPIESDMRYLNHKHVLLGYLHLAPNPPLTQFLLENKVIAFALEHIEIHGAFVALNPMSDLAGKIAVQTAAYHLYTSQGGKGILLGGIAGISRGRVTILGAGTAGRAAAQLAANMGASVTVFDINPLALKRVAELHPSIDTMFMDNDTLSRVLQTTDILIGAVYIPGKSAPKLVTNDMVNLMEPGSVIVDISADQGGCIESIYPTSHEIPSYEYNNVIHIGIPNLPGAVPRTASTILSGTIVQYVKDLLMSRVTGEPLPDYLQKSLCTAQGNLRRT